MTQSPNLYQKPWLPIFFATSVVSSILFLLWPLTAGILTQLPYTPYPGFNLLFRAMSNAFPVALGAAIYITFRGRGRQFTPSYAWIVAIAGAAVPISTCLLYYLAFIFAGETISKESLTVIAALLTGPIAVETIVRVASRLAGDGVTMC